MANFALVSTTPGGGKFATSINVTGGKFFPLVMLVSLMLLANKGNNIRLLTI
jgi:hypothetical protein